MHRVSSALIGAALLSTAAHVSAESVPALQYPDTRKQDLVETQFGEAIADPYRWLENDVRTDKDVADWVERQNALTQAYLKTLPQRGWFAQRIRALTDYERFGLPQKAGKSYFYTRNSGLQNQSQLFVRTGLNGEARLLIDPNTWAKDGATALDAWVPSHDGKLLAYSIQDGGSDWRTIKVIDVKTGKVLSDEIKWAKFTGIAWVGSEGFLYSRFPQPQPGQEFQSLNKNQAIYFHRIGTPQSADELVYATPDRPELGHFADVTADNRWVVISTSRGTDAKYELHVVPLAGQKLLGARAAVAKGGKHSWAVHALVPGLNHEWRLVEGLGDTLYFATNKDAPKLKVVKVDLSAAPASDGAGFTFSEVIPERAETLDRAQIVGNRLILSYLRDAASTAEVVSLDGKPVRQIVLNAIGKASGFTGRPGDPETFYAFSSFIQPSAIYRFDSNTGESTPFALPKLTFAPDSYAVEQRFYTSRDGTRVPMCIVRKKGLVDANQPAPTLLYGYGGFDVALTPSFSAVRMAWLEAGGVFAMANLRGGGEYGKAWHDAGRLAKKQNVFDDFIAAGEYLIAQGITPKGGLTVQGGSNGGLLVGAVVNQRPDLFAAGNAAVGVMDMLRFDRFTAGRYWVDDYGYPGKEADFRVLRAYSPYHNIKVGVNYPAMLVTTGLWDSQVQYFEPAKWVARLRAKKTDANPLLMRTNMEAGHGGKSGRFQRYRERAEEYAFVLDQLGLVK